MKPEGMFNRPWLAAAIGYAVLLLVLTHAPPHRLPAVDLTRFELDKLLHLLSYAGLAWLCLRAVRPDRAFWRWALVAGLLIGLAGLDEWTQSVTGRQADVLDFSADVIGISGVYVCKLHRRLKSSLEKP